MKSKNNRISEFFDEKPVRQPGTRVAFTLNPDPEEASLIDEAVELSWIVKDEDGLRDFEVNLNALLPSGYDEKGFPNVALVSFVDLISENKSWLKKKSSRKIKHSHEKVIFAFAPEIKNWSKGRRCRSVREELHKFSWLVSHLDSLVEISAESAAGASNSKDFEVNDIFGTDFGRGFAEWLRKIKEIENRRRQSIYMAVRGFVGRLSGTYEWPVVYFHNSGGGIDEDDSEDSTYTVKEQRALLQMATSVLKRFMKARRQHLSVLRKVQKQDPEGKKKAYHVCNKIRASYHIRNGIALAKQHLKRGTIPPNYLGWSEWCIVPNAELVAAAFLIALIRSGGENEQPLLDTKPGMTVAPGPWLQSNPFGSNYRIILLWKNRSGSRGAKAKQMHPLSFPAKPQFYPVKVLRYVELLGLWARRCASALVTNRSASKGARTAAKAARQSMWIYWSRGMWRHMNGSSTHSLINRLIAYESRNWPDLLGADGEPIRYQARKIRNDFVEHLMTSEDGAADVPTVQHALHHSLGGNTIRHYLKRKWAKKYVFRELRKFQSAARAIRRSGEESFKPSLFRQAMTEEGRKNLKPPSPAGEQVRYGLRCRDRSDPPPTIKKDKYGRCPAESCEACSNARCFVSGLPELASEILHLRRHRETIPVFTWSGSSAEARLGRLEELISRFSKRDQRAAYKAAEAFGGPEIYWIAQ